MYVMPILSYFNYSIAIPMASYACIGCAWLERSYNCKASCYEAGHTLWAMYIMPYFMINYSIAIPMVKYVCS